MTLKIVRNILDLRKETAKWRSDGFLSAVVPTMGALHQGHVALVRAGLEHAERIVATIFVNPKQFGEHEDLGRYPRTETSDLAQLEDAGAHLVFAPQANEIYPPGFATSVVLAGPAKAGLEAKIRGGEAPTRATAAARRSLTTLGFRVDYVAARNAETLALPKEKDEPLRLLVAAWLGTTRLIDNIAV